MGKEIKESSEDKAQEQEQEQKEVLEVHKRLKKPKKEKVSKRSKRMDKVDEEPVQAVDDKRAVIYVGHLPYGFEEAGLRKFFEQFGTITRLKMSRSKKVRISARIHRLQEAKAMLLLNTQIKTSLKSQLIL